MIVCGLISLILGDSGFTYHSFYHSVIWLSVIK